MSKYKLLILSPQKQWKLWKATLFSAEREGELHVLRGTVAGIDSENELWKVWRKCESTSADRIYEEFGKTYKKQEKFWESAEEKLKRHVKHVADMRVSDAVRMAEDADIPVYIRRSHHDDLYADRQLMPYEQQIVPQMHFVRRENDITYQLTLLVEGKAYRPHDMGIEVISNTPALFAANMNGRRWLMRMDQSFSTALLEPFATKTEIIIPRRIENEYMHKFILKNVAKTEIISEGFDIDETDVERRAQLCLEHSFNGRAVVTLRFRYGTRTYDADSKSKAEVRLEPQGDGFRFVRISRSAEWESRCRQTLYESIADWSDSAAASHKDFPDMATAVMWLSKHRATIDRLECFDIKQYASTPYYLGKFRTEQYRTWQNDWLRLHITIVMDDGEKVPFLFFRDAIIHGTREMTLPSGKLFLLPEEWFAKYAGMLMMARSEGQCFVLHSSQMAALGIIEQDFIDTEEPVTQHKSDSVSAPTGLRATLRPYQDFGFRWLYRNFTDRTGCCLADEMGLGKTVQTIALLSKYKEQGKPEEKKPKKKNAGKPIQLDLFADLFAEEKTEEKHKDTTPYLTSIVICPSSLVHNWRNELMRFAPDLTVCEYVGNRLQRAKKLEHLMRWDVVITTYRTAVNDIEMLSGLQFGICVFDESQMFKNRSSQIYAAMSRMRSLHRMALSGTPMENNLDELWSLMNILNDRLLGDHKTFRSNFTAPISENLASERTRILERIVAPYFLARHKHQVLSDLPPRQDIMMTVDMDEEQEQLYAEELSAARNVVLGSTGFCDGPKPRIEGGSIHVLTAIGRLRQLANDPRLLSHHVPSAKTDTVLMHLEELRGTEHKVLLFSDYVAYLDILADEMKQRDWQFDMLTGETQNREQVIRHFNESADTQFFLISLKAGGVGLNLTSADYVFMLTPWWNRAAEEQAVSRAYRIGQQRGVFVYNFVTKDTLEEQILTLQDRKQSLIDAVLPFLK